MQDEAAPDHSTSALPPERLRPYCAPDQLGVKLSSELEPVSLLTGQQRAAGAIDFGAGMQHKGYNFYVLSPEGLSSRATVIDQIGRLGIDRPPPDDWVYVHNFETAWKPQAIRLPSGMAQQLSDALIAMVDDLRSAIPALFESEDYKERRRQIDDEHAQQEEEAFEDLRRRARDQDIGILRTPMGFALAPVHNGQVVKPDVFNALPEAERKVIEDRIAKLQEELANILRNLPDLETQRRDKIRALNADLAKTLVDRAIAGTAKEFVGIAVIAERLKAISQDLVENIEMFLADTQEQDTSLFPVVTTPIESDPRFKRYLVNIMVARDQEDGERTFPIVYENHPTLAQLVGRIEHISHMGTLITDFSMVRAGALHRANGGYLVLDARKLLSEPWSWEALKRTLMSGKISITTVSEQLGLASTTMLEPEPIDLDVKVVLIGERILYYLLSELDPDFGELFKVQVDFDDEFENTPENTKLYARLIATIGGQEKLKAMDAGALAALIEEAARVAGDAKRLSLKLNILTDLMREADHWAARENRAHITAADVVKAVDEQVGRADRIRDKSLEAIERNIMLIDTEGAVTGQVNGLSVSQLGAFSFGRPSRITARVRMGSGKVVDIERETKLGGPIHSKGVLILSSYLAANYATQAPMSLWASLVFEQSYGGVEGDSASCAELFALISALSDTPIRQSLAVTGSVNQLGEVQAIGGVNEKIEGFFDICQKRGLTGEQGVLIPQSNIEHLVLRPRVVDAVRAGQFFIHAFATVDAGLELLTGQVAGRRGADGRYPPDTINARVEARLEAYAAARRAFMAREEDETHERNRQDES